MSIDRYVVVDNQTGAVLKIGYTDFSNDHDPASQTPILLASDAHTVVGVPYYYQKIVDGQFIEMGSAEKLAVDIAKIPPQHIAQRYPDSESDPAAGEDGDRYYNTLLGIEMQYDCVRGKWLSAHSLSIHAERNGVTPPGAYYRGSDGLTMSKTRGVSARFKGTVVAITYTRDTTNPATFEIVADGEPIAELLSTSRTGFYNHLDGDFPQGAILAIRNKADGSPTEFATVDVEIRWRV
jgi:hypothetical protein